MQPIGQSCGYNLYTNFDGFIEGYKSTGKQEVNGSQLATGMGHIVTNCKTIAEFEALMASNKKSSLKPITPDPPTLF